MKQVVIENPILNSPYEEPKRHFRFTEDGITNDVVEARRVSSYFVPIPALKRRIPNNWLLKPSGLLIASRRTVLSIRCVSG